LEERVKGKEALLGEACLKALDFESTELILIPLEKDLNHDLEVYMPCLIGKAERLLQMKELKRKALK